MAHLGITNSFDRNYENFQIFFLPNYKFCKIFCQTAKWSNKFGFYVTIFWKIHFWRFFTVISLPICHLDVKNWHLNNRNVINVSECLLCFFRARNVIDHNVVLKRVENFNGQISMLSKIIKRGISEHKDIILS